MRVYLMRHGKTVPQVMAESDYQRTLTAEGEADVRLMGAWLATVVDESLGLYISPLVRTQQTATIVAAELRSVGRTVLSATWFPLCRKAWKPIGAAVEELRLQQMNAICLVSHQPFLEKWIRDLTGTVLSFQTAGVAVLDYDGSKWRLDGYITPQLLRGVL